MLGPTFDYPHRLIDFALESQDASAPSEPMSAAPGGGGLRRGSPISFSATI